MANALVKPPRFSRSDFKRLVMCFVVDEMNVDEKFDKFIEFPNDSKAYVTSVSAKLFAKHCVKELETAIRETIEDNLHLADGENCTLIKLKRAINYDG